MHLRLMNCSYVLFAVGGFLLVNVGVRSFFRFISDSDDLSVQVNSGMKIESVQWHLVSVAELHEIYIGTAFVSAGVILGALVFRNLKRKGRANQALQHNDPSCHESCLRTPRASRDRG